MTKPTPEEFVKDIEDAPGPTPAGTPEGIEEVHDAPKNEHHERLGHHVDKLEGLVGKIEEVLSAGGAAVNDVVEDDDSPVDVGTPWTHRKIF